MAVFDGLGLRHGPVTYKKVHEVGDGTISFDQIPFIKRYPYQCEEEYRVILEDSLTDPFHEVEVELSMIRKVTINQRMPEPVYRTIKSYLRSATSDPAARIHRSTLYENKMWLNKFKCFHP